MPTDLKSFDLPGESEMRFSVNLNLDFIIEYALRNVQSKMRHCLSLPLTGSDSTGVEREPSVRNCRVLQPTAVK